MPLTNDLQAEVAKIFREPWSTRSGEVVPDPGDISLGNEAVEFERATVLYADLSGSTTMVNTKSWQISAEVYKTFLHCAAKIIRESEGTITAYDGDRIMAVFIGNTQTTKAAKCGLKINYAVTYIVNPALTKQYGDVYRVKHVVGIDTSAIRAARIGVRGGNDIVWVGRAANYAAKLTEINLNETTWLTGDAYDQIHESAKLGGAPPQEMWKKYKWSHDNDIRIYGSTWWWQVS